MSPSFLSKIALVSFLSVLFHGLTVATNSRFDGLHLVKRIPTPQGNPTELKVTSNNAPLSRVRNPNRSSSSSSGGLYPKYGNSPLQDLYEEAEWAVEVTVGEEKVILIIDTGSSDTWIAQKGFECTTAKRVRQPESACAFGPLYNGTFTEGEIQNENFNIIYEEGTFLSGVFGYSQFEIAGIKVPRAQVALVNNAFWEGDGITSGLMGLSYSALTFEFVGNNTSIDNWNVTGTEPGDEELYAPLVQTMITDGLLGAPVFSLALMRSSDDALDAPGGYIAFGGLPPVSFDPDFTSVPIEIYNFYLYPSRFAKLHSFYTIAVEGYTYTDSKTGKITQHNNTNNGIIDSGTTFLFVPTSIYNGYISSFDPPVTLKQGYNYWPCTSTAPPLGINIGGTIFNISSADIILPDSGYINKTTGEEFCIIGIGDAGSGYEAFPIFGDVFLKNVVAVFDIGASMMRLAAHVY